MAEDTEMTDTKPAPHLSPDGVAASHGSNTSRRSDAAGARREERSREILEEARQLFSEAGYAGFSVRALARRLGMSQGHLQYYFAKKEQLFEALIRSIIERYEPLRIVADFEERGPEERLKGFVEVLIQDLKDPVTNSIFFELWSIGQRDRFAMTMVDRFYDRYITNFDTMIAGVNPQLDPKRRSRRAALAATQVEGLMILLASGRPHHDYLVGLDQECVAQILQMAREP